MELLRIYQLLGYRVCNQTKIKNKYNTRVLLHARASRTLIYILPSNRKRQKYLTKTITAMMMKIATTANVIHKSIFLHHHSGEFRYIDILFKPIYRRISPKIVKERNYYYRITSLGDFVRLCLPFTCSKTIELSIKFQNTPNGIVVQIFIGQYRRMANRDFKNPDSTLKCSALIVTFIDT